MSSILLAPKQLPTIPTAVDASVLPENPSDLQNVPLWTRGREGTQKWTPQDKERGSKLVKNLRMTFVDDGQHIFYL